MAKETAVSMFLGTDLQLVFHIKNEAEDTSIDITGWALSWKLKRNLTDPDAKALIVKNTALGIVIAGAFNANPATNLQRATVTLAESDSQALASGVCRHEAKRTDVGFETVLAYGAMTLLRGVHRA